MAILETRRPYYQEVRHDLAQKIVSGIYDSGGDLPSIRDLSGLYGTSHITVSRALELLAQEGLIRCRRGSRARVIGSSVENQGKLRGLRIAVLHNSTLPNALYEYDEGPCGWLIQQYALERLIRDHNPALPVALRGGDWRRMLAGVDGVFALTLNEEVHRELLELRIPFVYVGYSTPGNLPGNMVLLDSFPAMVQMATYFIAGGVKRVLFTATTYSETLERAGRAPDEFVLSLTGNWKPFFEMLLEHGFRESDFRVMRSSDFKAKMKPVFREHLAELRRAGPVGVMTNGDLLAREAVDAALELGMTLKKEVFVTGASGLPESSSRTPALSVEQPPYRQAAELAVDLLYEQIKSGNPAAPNRFLPVKFVIRQT